MMVLVTAGPTREPVDDIRFISNRSSGRMGVALVEEALARGIAVTLVCGPTQEKPPAKARTIWVETAAEMKDAVLDELSEREYDVFISAAAVADYTTEKKAGKLKSGGELTIKLKPTTKIVDAVKKNHPELFVVGFKAEHGLGERELIESAKQKMRDAGLDLVVANDVGGGVFGSGESQVYVIDESNNTLETGRKSKREIAKTIWDVILESLSSGT